MKTHLRILIISTGIILGLPRCEKESSNKIDGFISDAHQASLISTNKFLYNQNSQNEYIEVFAKALSKSLENKDLRALVKKEALRMFDGDYDVLYKNIQSKTIEGKAVDKIITKNFLALQPDMDKLSQVTKNNRLQISIPVNCEKWNTEKSRPLVAYVPVNFDEKKFTAIKAFDSNLNEIWLSTKNEPDFPVIVVGFCERVDDNGVLLINNLMANDSLPSNESPINLLTQKDISSTKGLLAIPPSPTELKSYAFLPFTIDLTWIDNSTDEINFKVEQRTSPYDFVEIATVPSNQNYYTVNSNLYLNTKYSFRVRALNASGSSNYSNIVYDYASARRESNWEYIYQMKFTDLSAVESWISGAPEIRWLAFNGSTQIGEVNYFEPSKRAQINNTWYTYNYKIFRWYLDSFGKVCTYQWIERDFPSGDIATLNIPIWSRNDDTGNVSNYGSISITIREKDDVIGSCPVDWRNPLTDIFNAGGIFQFTMRNLSY